MTRRAQFLLIVAMALVAFTTPTAVWAIITPDGQYIIAQTRWWWSDETPPIVAITVPKGTIRGTMTATITIQDEGPTEWVSLMLDGAIIPPTTVLSLDTRALPDGNHTIVATVHDLSRQRNVGVGQASFSTDNTPPRLSLNLYPPVVSQGHVSAIRLVSSEPLTWLVATRAGVPLPLYPDDGAFMNILGYGPEAMMGSEPIIVSASDAVGNVASVTATLTVTRFVFPVEDVRQEAIAIPSDRVGLLAPEIANAEAETLGKVFGSVRPARLWEGLFLVPAPGEETSPFAIRRSYNGGPLGSFHAGVDLGMKSGTAVVAANSGVVVLAEPLRVRGNAIIIDHGLGLFTAYYHLSQIQVRVGQLVKKGDRIGYSGDTGLSTGPHLHWEMRVGGEPVDPWEWTRRVIP